VRTGQAALGLPGTSGALRCCAENADTGAGGVRIEDQGPAGAGCVGRDGMAAAAHVRDTFWTA